MEPDDGLPEHTRQWLEKLREEDLEDLEKILIGYRRTSTIVWFFKWLLVTIVGGFMTTWTIGEKLLEIAGKFKGK